MASAVDRDLHREMFDDLDRDGRREVSSPLTRRMLRPLGPHHTVLQFTNDLTEAEYEAVAEMLRPRPDITLRVYYAGGESTRSLEFLRFFPFLRRFDADAMWDSLVALDGLRFLPDDLLELTLGATAKKLDLAPIGRFTHLRVLSLERQQRGIEVISRLTNLRALWMSQITLPGLELLESLEHLRSLVLTLGGTSNLDALPRLRSVEHLDVWNVRALADLTAIGRMPNLWWLRLGALARVVALPDFAEAARLERLEIENLSSLHDFRPLLSAPALKHVALSLAYKLQPEDVRPLADHATLETFSVGTGSLRRNVACAAAVGRPECGPPPIVDWAA